MTDECTVDVSKCTISTTTTSSSSSLPSRTIKKAAAAATTAITKTTTTTTRSMSTPQEQRQKRKEKRQEQTKNATDAKTTKATTGNATNNANHTPQTNGKNGTKNGFGDIRMLLDDDNHDDDKPDAFGFSTGSSSGNGLKLKIEHVARMATARSATEYNMNHKNRGRALIFNHESYDIPDLSKRNGTDKDCDDLTDVLKELHFEVSVHKDCKLKEILQHIEQASSTDHSDNDCLVIAILSHGDHGCLYASDCVYKLDNIAHYFTAHNCPTLAGKPKLFFIQACRGDNFDAGIMLTKKTETDGESSTASYKIPVHADFLFAYSTIPGYYSWRSPDNGSWFIQALVHELRTNGKVHDILTLLTFVNQRVAFDKESFVPGNHMMHNRKQIPCITSMLTRILRFNDKNNLSGDEN